MECGACSGKQDLSDRDCLKGVICTLAVDPSGVEEVVLSHHWEVRYDHDCAVALVGLAEVTRFLKGISFEPRLDDCEGCPSNPSLIAKKIISSMPCGDAELIDGLSISPGRHGRICEQCAMSLNGDIQHARALLLNVRSAINRSAYRVVSADAR